MCSSFLAVRILFITSKMSGGGILIDDSINIKFTDDVRSCCVKKGQTRLYLAGQLVVTNCCRYLQVFDPKKPTREALEGHKSKK